MTVSCNMEPILLDDEDPQTNEVSIHQGLTAICRCFPSNIKWQIGRRSTHFPSTIHFHDFPLRGIKWGNSPDEFPYVTGYELPCLHIVGDGHQPNSRGLHTHYI